MGESIVETAATPADLLARMRDLSFRADREAAAAGMRTALQAFDALGTAGGEPAARANAYRQVLAVDATGSLAAAAAANAPMRAVIQVNELLQRSGRLDVAAAVVQAYHRAWPGHEALRMLATMTRGIGRPDGTFRDDAARDMQVVRKAGAGATLLVFTGVNHGFGMSLNLLHHFWLSALNANVIFLRDFEGLLYLGGVGSLGDEAATLDALGATIRDLGAPRVATLGFSLGNFAAIYYGIRLAAQHAIAFAGPTSLDIGLQFPNKQSYPKVKALHDAGKLPWPDLRAMLAAAPGLQVRCFYSEQNRADRLQGENLRGLDNVRITPLAGSAAHFTLEQLAVEGKLAGILREAAGLV